MVTSSTVGSLFFTFSLKRILKEDFEMVVSTQHLEYSKLFSSDSLGFTIIKQYTFKNTDL